MPQRIQLSRRKGWRKPAGVVVVSRPSKWGNPMKVTKSTDASMIVGVFRALLEEPLPKYARRDIGLTITPAEIRAELRGKDLACWCKIGEPCHADVLLELANA